MAEAHRQPQPDLQWQLHGDLPCLGCQYNLRGLVGPLVKCPECGHVNDLRDPTPWRTKKLPTGVRVREHWPASAALASFFVLVTGFWTLLVALTLGLAALMPGAAFGLAGGWWALACVRWLRSCQNRLWGWSVLMGTHLAMWGILLGMVVPLSVDMQPPWALVGLALPAAVVAFFWLRSIIRTADRTAQFRSDWRKWQLPTGPAGDPTPADHEATG